MLTAAVPDNDDGSDRPAYRQLSRRCNNVDRFDVVVDAAGDVTMVPRAVSPVGAYAGGVFTVLLIGFMAPHVYPGHTALVWAVAVLLGFLTTWLPRSMTRAAAEGGPYLEFDADVRRVRLPRVEFDMGLEYVSRLQLVTFYDRYSSSGDTSAFVGELQLVDDRGHPWLVAVGMGGHQLKASARELGRLLDLGVSTATVETPIKTGIGPTVGRKEPIVKPGETLWTPTKDGADS